MNLFCDFFVAEIYAFGSDNQLFFYIVKAVNYRNYLSCKLFNGGIHTKI